jgi:hypothetical protein
MLQNAYFLAKIGADTAENEQHFAEICRDRDADRCRRRWTLPQPTRLVFDLSKTKRLVCLLPQEPDNLSSLRAAKNRTDANQEHRRLQSSGTDARKIQKKKRFCCLLPQEPTSDNFKPTRAAKNRTDATQECRCLRSSGTNE